ncbi:Heparinase II/III-like protein [Stieleria maiorica]|uniref:Heparinase II/III-like protein n=2 Tax=Stieleria maiorica TaxID=2795974 RepID=A0A5B9MEU5_9BACT|nr:Heparinase II/III-like protein [Stieleria maiorica]
MGPAEVGGRVLSELQVKKLHWAARQNGSSNREFAVPVETAIQRCIDLVPGSGQSELARLRTQYPQYFQSLQKKSESIGGRIASGSYSLLGKPFSADPKICWNTDPTTGHTWSDDFFKQVAYHKSPGHVDFKNIWELGRQQYAVELSRSWLLNGNRQHGELARDMVLSWIFHNPFCRGIHWTSGLEVAMRAISWIWTLANLRDFPFWATQQRERVISSLGQHAYYLENHFSFYSSPYNHVIGEASGLCLIACVLRESKHANRWKRRAIQVLKDFAPRQFYADGFCVEQAMGYHYYTLGFLVLAESAMRIDNGAGLGMDDLMVQAFRTGVAFRQSDGSWPAIGDVDSAQSIPVARDEYWDFSPMHQLAAVLFEDPLIAVESDAGTQEEDGFGLGDELYWLTGCNGLRRRTELSARPTNPISVFPDAGYFVAGNGSDHVVFDAGPISHGLHRDSTPSAAHGHADTLQLLYQFDGKPVLIDSGMPNYAGNPQRAAHFRSPQAHNTVSLSDAELVRSRGVLDWSNEVQTPTLRHSGDSDRWIAFGEIQWPDCRIARHILAIPGRGLWVADLLHSEHPRTATWHWQFPPGSDLTMLASEPAIHVRGTPRSVRAVGSVPLSTGELCDGDENKQRGWTSPGYGVIERGCTLTYQAHVESAAVVLTHFGDCAENVGFDVDGCRVQFSATEDDSKAESCDSAGRGNWFILPTTA